MTVEAQELRATDAPCDVPLAVAPRREREFRLGDLNSLLMRASHAVIVEIAAAMSDGGLVGDSAADMRAWLVHNLGASPTTARGWIKLAQRMDELPQTMRRLETGEVSIDAAVVIAKHGQSEDEADLAEMASEVTTVELTRIAKDMRPATTPHEIRENEFIKEVHWFSDEREGWWWIKGRLPLADGHVVERALRRMMDRAPAKDPWGHYYPHEMMAAEALIELAGTNLDNDPDPDRATVVLHVTQPLEANEQQLTLIENGPAIPEPSAHRLTCDARCQVVLHTADGTVIGVGRTTRIIPMWLRRVVRGRDRGCRFPGCDRTEHLQIHHIRHWGRGGPTDLDNLITLCARHHRLLHEHGWHITGSPDNPIFEIKPGSPYEPIRRLVIKDPPPWENRPKLTPAEILELSPSRT